MAVHSVLRQNHARCQMGEQKFSKHRCAAAMKSILSSELDAHVHCTLGIPRKHRTYPGSTFPDGSPCMKAS